MFPEDRLLGHYRLVRRIGSGSMGEVYLAEDTRISRQVAIKVVRTERESYPDPVMAQDTIRLFQREMQAVTMLDHPHILPLFDFGEEKEGNSALTYMVMPYRQEGSLADWLQKRGTSEKLTPNEVAHFVMQAADALQHAHDHHLIHQDVKPSNFLVRERVGNSLPDLLLMDFGIAKITTATAAASQNVRGTPAFMAPEQWEGRPQPATDQYALAVMAYLLLTGHPLFSGRMEQVMRQHYMAQPQPPSRFNPAISPALDVVILRALDKQPARRFPSILAFAQAFQQALQPTNQGFPAIAPQQSPNVSTPLPPTPMAYPPGFQQPAPMGPASNPGLSEYPPTTTDTNVYSPNWGMAQPPPPPPPAPPIASQSRSLTKKSALQLPVLIGLAILVIISGVIGVGLYQNHVSQVNASATKIANNNATSTAQANATATAQVRAYPTYLSGNGTLAFADPLSQANKWHSSSPNSNGGACQFTDGAYHVSQQDKGYFMDCDTEGVFSNFAFEVQLTIVKGDCGGMVFRDDYNGHFYNFLVCQDGTYKVSKYVSNKGSETETLRSGNGPAINAGLGRQNKIAVVASGSTMTFYVNGQKTDQAQDYSYTSGHLELVADPRFDNPTDVAYANARVWTL